MWTRPSPACYALSGGPLLPVRARDAESAAANVRFGSIPDLTGKIGKPGAGCVSASRITRIWGVHLTGVRDLPPRAARRRSLQAGRMSALSRRLGRNSLWAPRSVPAWGRSIAPVYAQLRLNGYPRRALCPACGVQPSGAFLDKRGFRNSRPILAGSGPYVRSCPLHTF